MFQIIGWIYFQFNVCFFHSQLLQHLNQRAMLRGVVCEATQEDVCGAARAL